jgi:hypothetical protein
MDAELRASITRFLEETPLRVAASRCTEDEKQKIAAHAPNVAAYLRDEGFLAHLEQSWRGPDQVVAIIAGEDGNVRGSLVKRADAFSFSNMQDTFLAEARLVMSADEHGVLFQELGFFAASDA